MEVTVRDFGLLAVLLCQNREAMKINLQKDTINSIIGSKYGTIIFINRLKGKI